MNQSALSSFIRSVAALLRGDYKQADYGKVILPFTLLRRLDCVLAPTKDAAAGDAFAVFLNGVLMSSLLGNDMAGAIVTTKGKIVTLENRVAVCT